MDIKYWQAYVWNNYAPSLSSAASQTSRVHFKEPTKPARPKKITWTKKPKKK